MQMVLKPPNQRQTASLTPNDHSILPIILCLGFVHLKYFSVQKPQHEGYVPLIPYPVVHAK
jgi:hypothetical protein